MKKIFLLIFVFALTSAKTQTPRVLIVPFNPDMYFSDSDQMLAEYNKKTVKEVRALFRYGINLNVHAKMLNEHGSVNMLSDTSQTLMKDLYNIYKGISYFQDKPMRQEEEVAKVGGLKVLKKKESNGGQQENKTFNNQADNTEYMNVKILNPYMIPHLKDKYKVDYVVFLNQFNLVTHYEHCLDRATNTFEREVMIHYSIFDATGKQIAGDALSMYFPSNTNNIMEIIEKNFPPLSDIITRQVPSGYTADNGSLDVSH